MIIQHNFSAINANNKLKGNIAGVKKSAEKAASGFRVNRAADDSAGLAISEKMRALTRALDVNVRNINDGISMINTADGAMSDLHAITQRMHELALMATNGTYLDGEERAYIDMEFQQLKEEIDRIVLTTEFNGIKIFEGVETYVQIGVPDKTFGDVDFSSDMYEVEAGENNNLTFRYNGVQHEITVPEGIYTRDELVAVLNALFEEELGSGKVTVSMGNPALGEGQYSLVFDANGGIFDSFGGNMMRGGNILSNGIYAALSIISDNLYQGGTTVGELRGLSNISSGVNINAGENTLSFRLNGEGGGDVFITFEPGFHSAQQIVSIINNYFKSNDMTATATLQNGSLVISRTLGGTSNTISNISANGAYDALFRAYTTANNYDYTRVNGTTTELFPTVTDPANPPPGVIERDGVEYIPPSGGSPTISNPNFGIWTRSEDVQATWTEWADITPRGSQNVSGIAVGDTVVREGARQNPTVLQIEVQLSEVGVVSRYTLSQTLTGNTAVTAGLNDTFSFQYGGTTYNVTIPEGTYSPGNLAAAINAQISEYGLSCSYSGNQLVFIGADGNYTDNFSNFTGSLLNSALSSVSGTVTGSPGSVTPSQTHSGQWTLTSQGYFQGAVALPSQTYITSGVNDELIFSLNGQEYIITLPQGVYTQQEMLAELQRQTAELDVAVSLNGGRLTFTNTSYPVGASGEGAGNIPNIGLVGGSALDTLFRTTVNTGGDTSTAARQPQYQYRYLVSEYIRDYYDDNVTIANPDYNAGNGSSLNWVYQIPQYDYTPSYVQRTAPATGYSFYSPMVIDGTNDGFVISVTSPIGEVYTYDITLDHGSYTVEEMYDQLNAKLSAIPDCLVQMAEPKSSLKIETTEVGQGWVVTLSQNNAFNTLYGKERRTYTGGHTLIQPTESSDAEAEGRVNLSQNPITTILAGVNDVLEFDIRINGEVKRYSITIEPGSYNNEDLIVAMNQAIQDAGVQGVRAELKTVATGLDGVYTTTTLIYTPNSSGDVVIEGIGGSAAYTVFYRGLQEDYYIAPEKVRIQVGPNGEPTLNSFITDVPIEVSLKSLKLDNARIDPEVEAQKAIDATKSAINLISKKRAISGAHTNELESTLANVVNYKENLTSAESAIRDADMANVMVNYTKFNILHDAAMAILAQANQMPQEILQLLT